MRRMKISHIVLIVFLVIFMFMLNKLSNHDLKAKYKVYGDIFNASKASISLNDNRLATIERSIVDSFITNTVTSIKKEDLDDLIVTDNIVMTFISNDEQEIESKLYFVNSKEKNTLTEDFIKTHSNGKEFILVVEYKDLMFRKYMLVELTESMMEVLSELDF